MTKSALLAALLALPFQDREDVCTAALAKPDPHVSESQVLAFISPRGVVRERQAVYAALTAEEQVALAALYRAGERCPFCDAQGKDSLFAGFVQPTNPESTARQATFANCKHRVALTEPHDA